MKELAIENLHKTYGTKTLIDGIDFSIRTGDRIGLIGPNGTGKSSLLKVIANIESYDQGEIRKPNDYSISYLSQNPDLDPEKTILETVYDSQAPIVQLVLKYEQSRLELENTPDNEAAQDNFMRLSEQMNQQNGWDLEVQAKSILTKLGLDNLNQKIADCSGGQQKRVGIAQVLISDADLLILDEPTNHLDVDSIQWLEGYLANYKGALLLVTHDRYFLERSVNKIVELRNGQLREYEGNYQAYLEKRSQEAAIESRMQEKQDRLFQQELAWMRKGAKARTTKQQARIGRFNDLKDDIGSRHGEAQELEINFTQQRIGSRIIDAEDLEVDIADVKVIRGFTKSFVKGDRLGIIGDNGVGKSTFLNTLAGMHLPTSGTLDIGQTVRMAYYRQMDQDLPNEIRVLKYLTDVADQFKQADGRSVSAAQMLERFNFDRSIHGMQIGSLSGGERRRLYLLSLLIQEPNVLLLDEPTNDLDIDTLTVLEDYLEDFSGVVIIVSHDRYFLDKTADQLLDIQGGGAFNLVFDSYSNYLDKQAAEAKAKAVPTTKDLPVPELEQTPAAKKVRLSYQEKQEWATIEDDIMEREMRLDEIQEEMVANGSDAGLLMDLQRELETINQELEHYYERYDYLSEIAEQA